MDNYETGIYTDNPDDTLRYMKTTQPVDLLGYPKQDTDMVEVVRCKYCCHTHARTADGENFHCGMFNLWMRHDFYCKYGIKSETKALVCSTQNMSTVMSSGMDTAIRYERANNCSDGERRSE